jgi:phage gpG-like protein
MVALEFEFFGDKEIARRFDRMITGVEDVTPAWNEMADDFARMEEERFASQGPGWVGLSPAYAARKRPQGPILTRTRRLRSSLTRRPFPVEQLGPQEASFGSNVEYGIYHQQGTPKMPRRVVVRLTNADRTRWVKMVQRRLFDSGGA